MPRIGGEGAPIGTAPQRRAAADGRPPDVRRALAFATVLVAFVLEVADATIVNTALPQIRAELAAGEAAMQWIVAAYFLSLGALLLVGGRLGDIYGYRRIFIGGVIGFVAASALCGLSRTADELVAARLLQGAAAAIMAPQVMAIVQVLYDPLERVARLAWFGIVGGLAAILGPILGGVLIEADLLGLGWRAIFLINLPVGLAAIAAGARFLPGPPPSGTARIDWAGMALFALAFATLILAIIEGPAKGWPVWCWGSLAASAGLLWSGWIHARRRCAAGRMAVIEPVLFRRRTFVWGLASVVAFSAASAGFLLVFAVSLQQGLGVSALDTALRHIPFGLGVMGGISLIGRRFLPRFGRWLVVAGAVVMGAGATTALLMIVAGQADGVVFIAALVVAGVGMGMVVGPLPPVIVSEVERAHAGSASATMKAAQQVGGAMGVAGVGAAYFSAAGSLPAARIAGLLPGGAAIVVLVVLTAVFAICLPAKMFQPVRRERT